MQADYVDLKMSEDRVIEFPAEHTDDELVEYWAWVYFGQPGQEQAADYRRRSARAVAVFGLVFLLLFLGLFVLISNGGWVSIQKSWGGLVLIGALAAGILSLAKWMYNRATESGMRRLWKQQVAKQRKKSATQIDAMQFKGRYRVDTKGISYVEEGTTTLIEWSAVRRVRDLKHGVGVLAKHGSIFLPKTGLDRAVESDGYQYLLAHADKYARTDQQVVSEFLVNNDVPCSSCKYNLKGVVSAVCPECGSELNRATLPEAFAF